MKRALVAVFVLVAATGCGKPSPWESLPLGTSADFRGMWFDDSSRGWISGGSYQITGGLLGRTADAGKTWRFASDLTKRDRMSVLALHFFDAMRGVAGTSSGAILLTTDGGENWTPASRQGRSSSVASLFFLDERRGWAAGQGDVLRTDDGGDTWVSLTPEGTEVAYRSPIRAIRFLDDRNGWAVGMTASLMRTRDGGVTWEPVATPIVSAERPDFWDLFFVDDQAGWVVGEQGTILATQDGGVTWARQDSGLKDARSEAKLERIPRAGGVDVIDAGDRTPGFTITSVRFITPSRGWIAGFYSGLGRSLILRTEDAGATWIEDAEVTGEDLYALFLQGRERLWAVGARVREGPQSIYLRALTK